MGDLAIDGGSPVRSERLPYGRQSVDEADVAEVTEVLQSDWLTTGPKVEEFEEALASVAGTREAVAVSSGTAALHAVIHAIGVEPGDEVIVPAMTFAATANCVVYQGGTPVFADVDPDTLLLDPGQAAAQITERTRAIIGVDYAGQACDYAALRSIAQRHGLTLAADACHAIGGRCGGRPVGALADLSTFSFHPVKHVTTAEGGAVTTDDDELARRMRVFRNHGITTDHRQREQKGSWYYEMVELGYNYRLSDLQCALGISQLRKLSQWVERRRAIARVYDSAFVKLPAVQPLRTRADVEHAYHLYVIRLDLERLRVGRAQVFAALRAEGIGVNVHYIPVHLHPYYREHFHTRRGDCPEAEAAYDRLITLPMFSTMVDQDVTDVVSAVYKVIEAYAV